MLDIAISDQEPAGRRVTLRGRLDTLTTPQLDGALAPLLGSAEVTSLVFEMDALEYVSSAGIRCVIRAQRTLADRGGAVAIVGPQPAVRRVFEIVKALPPELIFTSRAELDAWRRDRARAPGHPQ